MKEIICTVCPRGCKLTIGKAPDYKITGNFCSRGIPYAKSEIINPKRVVTTSCSIENLEKSNKSSLDFPRRVPVKTSDAILKSRVFDLIKDLEKIKIKIPVKAGTAIIENWDNSGVSIIVTRDVC